MQLSPHALPSVHTLQQGPSPVAQLGSPVSSSTGEIYRYSRSLLSRFHIPVLPVLGNSMITVRY